MRNRVAPEERAGRVRVVIPEEVTGDDAQDSPAGLHWVMRYVIDVPVSATEGAAGRGRNDVAGVGCGRMALAMSVTSRLCCPPGRGTGSHFEARRRSAGALSGKANSPIPTAVTRPPKNFAASGSAARISAARL